MSEIAIQTLSTVPANLPTGGSLRLPPVPWRDPHSVPPEQLAEIISGLERACAQDPANADLRVCLGMAHAMNYDPYRSMDALEEARRIAPESFLAQLKYAELFYRLRALELAETETHRALNLAGNGWELAMARHQLSEIRRLKREGSLKPTWTKSLIPPLAGFGVLIMLVGWLFMVYR
jgi:hypothetical protein